MNKNKKITLIVILSVIVVALICIAFTMRKDKGQNDVEDNDSISLVEDKQPSDSVEKPEDKVIDPVIEYNNEMDEYKTESKIDIGEAIINDNEVKNEDGAGSDKNETAKKYTSIDLTINMDENPGFALLDLRCYYNPAVVSVNRVIDGEVHSGLDTSPVVQNDSYGTYILLDFDYLGYDFNETGWLASISFDVLDSDNISAAGIEIVMQEIYNSDAKEVDGYSFNTDVSLS